MTDAPEIWTAPLELEATTALIVVDLQEFVRRLPYTHDINGVAANAARLADAFRAAGRPVVFTKVAGGRMGTADRRAQLPSTIRPADLELMPELKAGEGDIVLPKPHWSAFADTDLAEQLRARGTTGVVIAGVATGFGVESTARAASDLDLDVTIAVDAMTDMDALVHECAVGHVFPAMARCRTPEIIVGALA